MPLRLLLALSLIVAAACERQTPLSERGAGTRSPPSPAEPREPGYVPAALRGTPAHPQPPLPIQVTETVQHPPPPDERDYAAELQTVIANPITCVPRGERGSFPPALTVRASVQVFDDGRVNRPSVSAPGLSADAIACLTERVGRFRFRAPVAPAPQTVTASVTFERRGDPAPVRAAEEARAAEVARLAAERAAAEAPPTTGQWAEGPTGQAIEAAPSQAIAPQGGAELAGPTGQQIAGPSGTMIEGPQGQPIGH